MRRKTREVLVGKIGVGGSNPIRAQSMTTTPTTDVQATVSQIVALADHGCEIVRVTVQGIKEARACESIKSRLLQLGYTIPIVADIHFFPKAALSVADFVDKVRINPGNYVDPRATFSLSHYEPSAYARELERLEEKFSPLVLKLKSQSKPIRIGVNHGSLSDRIMNRYGDCPEGMVESAIEYTRVCRKLDYHDLIFSMKSSNTVVMIEAYRLLARRFEELGWDYPFHLGVTEAGEGIDGRIKSAIGIGTLLLEGIGDTIRVSLTEDPIYEIPVCRDLINLSQNSHQVPIGRWVQPRKEPDTLPKNMHTITVEEVINRRRFELYEGDYAVSVDDTSWPLLDQITSNRVVFRGSYYGARQFLTESRFSGDVYLGMRYKGDELIRASAECGSLLVDGRAEGLALEFDDDIAYAIMQGARRKVVKTEFISCPSCGRTLFDLQTVTRKIRKKTEHLPGVRIAVMGCIVNGPGEMADAHFGFVGSKPGKIDLYLGKNRVESDIPFDEAEERLISLIKAQGMWENPPLTKNLLPV